MTITPPIDAAAVILVRELPGAPGWQTYMIRRPTTTAFAPDVYVFPGGRVDPDDDSTEMLTLFESHRDAARERTRFRVAAARELFEEAGVLLARRSTGRTFDRADGTRALLEDVRGRLRAGDIDFREVLQEANLRLDLHLLLPFARWITPEGMPRRFDTMFYLARLPEGQHASHDEGEATDGLWLTPSEALQRFREGRFPLVFATERQLMRLQRFPDLASLFHGVGPADLDPVMPRMVRAAGRVSYLLPGDEGYGDPPSPASTS